MKKVISIVMSLLMIVGVSMTGELQVYAADTENVIDGSYLLDDEMETTGEMEVSTWGYYLKSGTCSLVEKGTGVINAGGSTTGNRVVDEISVTVVVQRLVSGKWQDYLTWSASKTDAAYVSTYKTLYVPTGYYYRVSCSHYAYTDTGYSNTDGLYID